MIQMIDMGSPELCAKDVCSVDHRVHQYTSLMGHVFDLRPKGIVDSCLSYAVLT